MTESRKHRPGRPPRSAQPEDRKEKLLEAAVALFARRGFHGVGIRDIAAEANVNVAMISYYYGSKVEILAEIVRRFFDRYFEIGSRAFSEGKTPRGKIERFVHGVVCFIRESPDLAKVGLYELPLDMPEIAAAKAEAVKKGMSFLDNPEPKDELSRLLNYRSGREFLFLNPFIVSALFSHLLLGSILENITEITLDEAYYEKYERRAATFITAGVLAIMKEIRAGR